MNKLVTALLLSILLSSVAFAGARPQKAVFILCYHTFMGNNPKSTIDFSVDEFRAQMREIITNGFRFVTYRDITNDTLTGVTNVLITVDDGFKSMLPVYSNVMKPMGIQPVIAIYPAIIGVGSAFMTWKDIVALANDGCEIASHGYNHERITADLLLTSPKVFSNEIYRSKKMLETNLGRPVTAFVYPYGVRSAVTVSNVRAAGYTCAFTIERGAVLLPLSENRDMHQLSRYMIITSKKDWENIMTYMKAFVRRTNI
ncbi:MAG: polysaccharide deacetylase family protein [Spirochaetes bacterium]|nr:polysaccharide deacetylase family protein [Spirochaetota bacterium]